MNKTILTKKFTKSLISAIVISQILLAPFLAYAVVSFPADKSLEIKIEFFPADDMQITDWYVSRQKENLKIIRKTDSLLIQYTGKIFEQIEIPEKESFKIWGYGSASLIETNSDSLNYFKSEKAKSDVLGKVMINLILTAQAGFFIVYLWRLKNKEVYCSNGPVTTKKVFFGIMFGFGLILGGQIYSNLISDIFGAKQDWTNDLWKSVTEFSTPAKLIVVLLGCIAAPISEELFFRKYGLGNFLFGKFISFGVLLSSLFFALFHFSFLLFPIYFLFGVALSICYIKTQSVVPCIIAHAINNTFAFVMILSK